MALRLRIVEPADLPEGTPALMEFADRPVLRIGRQAGLDWVLPDPGRSVSSQHCEIHPVAAGFELHDLSTNGTFFNGEEKRTQSPRRLADGDRIAVGRYELAVELTSGMDAGFPESDMTQVLSASGGSLETQVLRAGTAPDPQRMIVAIAVSPNDTVPPAASAALEGFGAMVIGRDSQSDLVLPDNAGMISRRHCEIHARDGGFELQDHSVNGVFRVGQRERLASGALLADGDRLRIGNYILSIEIGSAARLAATPATRPTPANAIPSSPVMAASPLSPGLARRGGDPAAMIQAQAGPAGLPKPSSSLPPPPPLPNDDMTTITRAPAARPTPAAPTHPAPTAQVPIPTSAQPAAPAQPPPAAVAPASQPLATQPLATQPLVAPPAEGAPANAAVERAARALGLTPADIAETDPAALAEQLATLVALAVRGVTALLAQRPELAPPRPSAGATKANPLETLPSAEASVRVLLGARQPDYLDAVSSFRLAFAELSDHHRRVAAALGAAANSFAAPLAPDAVEKSVDEAGGRGLMLGSRKARLWDAYGARWSALTGNTPEGAAKAFARLFADAFQSGGR